MVSRTIVATNQAKIENIVPNSCHGSDGYAVRAVWQRILYCEPSFRGAFVFGR